MTKYMVWALVKHNLRRAFIDAESGFAARKRYAESYGIPVTECMARKVD